MWANKTLKPFIICLPVSVYVCVPALIPQRSVDVSPTVRHRSGTFSSVCAFVCPGVANKAPIDGAGGALEGVQAQKSAVCEREGPGCAAGSLSVRRTDTNPQFALHHLLSTAAHSDAKLAGSPTKGHVGPIRHAGAMAPSLI